MTQGREAVLKFYDKLNRDYRPPRVPGGVEDFRAALAHDEALANYRAAELRRQEIERCLRWLHGFLFGVVAGCAACRLYDWVMR